MSSRSQHIDIKMNLMFRKNFREQKTTTTKSGIGKSGIGRHTNKRLNRDTGYTAIEEQHYRTHIFFCPKARSSHNLNEIQEGKQIF